MTVYALVIFYFVQYKSDSLFGYFFVTFVTGHIHVFSIKHKFCLVMIEF